MNRRVILVSGASNGIGKDLVEKLLDGGEMVVGLDIAETSVSSENYRHILCDFSDPNLVSVIDEALGGEIPTHFVNCVAIPNNTSAENPDHEKIHTLFNVNVIAPWLVASLLLRKALQAGRVFEVILFITSVHAFATSKNRAAYATSKAAVSGLTRSLAIDFAQYGVRVNAIAPGAIKTAMLTGLDSDAVEKLEGRLLTKGIAGPDAVTSMVLHLLSSEAKYVTGQTFVVDGGALSLLATEV